MPSRGTLRRRLSHAVYLSITWRCRKPAAAMEFLVRHLPWIILWDSGCDEAVEPRQVIRLLCGGRCLSTSVTLRLFAVLNWVSVVNKVACALHGHSRGAGQLLWVSTRADEGTRAEIKTSGDVKKGLNQRVWYVAWTNARGG